MPGGMAGTLTRPSASERTVRSRLVSRLETVTLALAITPRDWSTTTPVRSAVVERTCANADDRLRHATNTVARPTLGTDTLASIRICGRTENGAGCYHSRVVASSSRLPWSSTTTILNARP